MQTNTTSNIDTACNTVFSELEEVSHPWDCNELVLVSLRSSQWLQRRGVQHLGGLATAGVPTDHHHIMLSQLGQQVLSDGQHRQAGPVLLPLAALPAAAPLLQLAGHLLRLCPLLPCLLPHLSCGLSLEKPGRHRLQHQVHAHDYAFQCTAASASVVLLLCVSVVVLPNRVCCTHV